MTCGLRIGPGSADAERGSTLPLLVGFFALAMVMCAGAVAVGDAFVQQTGLQSVCDGAAVAAAAGSADLARDTDRAGDSSARLAPLGTALSDYLRRDPSRRAVTATGALSAAGTRIDVTCSETVAVTFGAVFGRGGGVRHVVHSSARAALS